VHVVGISVRGDISTMVSGGSLVPHYSKILTPLTRCLEPSAFRLVMRHNHLATSTNKRLRRQDSGWLQHFHCKPYCACHLIWLRHEGGLLGQYGLSVAESPITNVTYGPQTLRTSSCWYSKLTTSRLQLITTSGHRCLHPSSTYTP